MKSFIKGFLLFFISISIVLIIVFKWGLGAIVSNKMFINYVENKFSEQYNTQLKMENLQLKTGRFISFKADYFEILKDGKTILLLKNIDTLFSLEKIFDKRIIVNKMLADEIFADTDDLIKIFGKEEAKEKKESPVFIDFYNVLMGVNKCRILYQDKDLKISFNAKNLMFDRTQKKKYLHFDFIFDLTKNNHTISVSANDKNHFYMEDGVAYIVDFPIRIEKSEILVNAFMTRKKDWELKVNGKNFSASDVADIVRSNAIIANGHELLAPVKDIQGNVNFDVKLTKKALNGGIKVDKVRFKVIPLLDLPVEVTKGIVEIGDKNIVYKEFDGFYNNKTENNLKMFGETKDYQKTCDTKIISDIFVTNDFFKNYLSRMLNASIELVGNANSRLVLKSKNGSCDIVWFFLLKEGEGFKFGDQTMVLKNHKTLFKADLSVIKNILKINTINYYITNELKRGIKPIITLDGNVNLENSQIIDLNLDIPNPLPSEFLNFLLGARIFKKGEVSGKMYVDNRNESPKLNGEFKLDKVLIPAERMFVNSAKISASPSGIILKSDGGFRRSKYDFNGHLINEIKFPIVVKDVNLTLDNIDVERILTQPKNTDKEGNVYKSIISTGAEGEENEEPQPFTKNLIEIKKCALNIKEGFYKEIKFGNLHADMTLDKDGNLSLKSNRFDIADGISSLRVKADLFNKKYYMKLGIKDVDSNIMASAILGLPQQISGKAKGLIEIDADETLKLNGDIKFKINDGTISQVGYVEYILKVASLFRNPLAMISPSTLVDLVNIPEGKFDEIQGEMKLKDNIIQRIKIESTAPELATLIFGRYDLSSNDASLRVYTKFTNKGKGFAGMLRNFSLNTLADKISISSRNDSNYYASELEQIPKLKNGEDKAQVFLTKVDGDVLNFNFLSSLKRIK